MLTTDDNHTLNATSDLIWHRHVPAKVSILAQSLLRKRLLTKDNLVAHGILTHDAHLCVTGCGEIETAKYSFFLVQLSGIFGIQSVIGQVFQWSILIIFLIILFSLLIRQVGWLCGDHLCSSFVFYVERNNRLFSHKENIVDQLLDKVKIHSYWWVKAPDVNRGSQLVVIPTCFSGHQLVIFRLFFDVRTCCKLQLSSFDTS